MNSLNRIPLNGLRALDAVARCGSLQAAADELGVSIGAVSQQVIKAELQLGRPVFTRTPKGLVATDWGAPLLVQLSEGFRILSAAVTSARQANDDTLTISLAPIFASRWLVHRLDRFSLRYPDIKLRIEATTRLVDPATSDVDLCIRVGPGHWPGVRSDLIVEQEIFPVCAPGMASDLNTPVDLLRLPAIVDGHAMFGWDLWLDAAGLSGQHMVPRHIFSEASLCLDAVIAGQGVMLAWQTLAVDAITEGRLVVPFDIRPRTGMGHYFVTAAGRRDTPKVATFKAWLREELAASMTCLIRTSCQRGLAASTGAPA